jgi:lipoprotein-anchoring transpeptidase ErfK/SrfK
VRSARVLQLITMLCILTALSCRKRSEGAPDVSPQGNAAATDSEGTPLTSIAAGEKGQLASKAMETYVYEQANVGSKKLGYLRAGAIVDRRGGIAGTKDCPGGWFPIQPRGFVCVGPTATLDTSDSIVSASFRRPALDAGLPYGYAVVRNSGAPFYSRLPSDVEAKAFEPDWDYHFRTLVGAEKEEADQGEYQQLSSTPDGPLPIEPAPGVLASWATDNHDDPMPPFLAGGGYVPNLSGLVWSQRTPYDGGTECDPKSQGCVPLDASRPMKRLGISFVASFRADKRRWLLTTDLLLMPADRVRLVRGTSFHGVELGGTGEGALELPIIFVKKEHAKRYRFEKKKMVESDEELPWRVALKVTPKQRIVAGVHYHELSDGTYVDAEDAARLDPIKKMPKWGKEGERWIEINIAKQTLLAVDGTKPVYATLVSTGSGGLASPKDDPYVTPRGIFRIHTKHSAATMHSNQPEAEFELRDVPYIQYFQNGFALHAAYWHDQFGMPRSHGCVNLAPLDAQRLFAFTKPELPPGWHGVMQALTGTVVWIHA